MAKKSSNVRHIDKLPSVYAVSEGFPSIGEDPDEPFEPEPFDPDTGVTVTGDALYVSRSQRGFTFQKNCDFRIAYIIRILNGDGTVASTIGACKSWPISRRYIYNNQENPNTGFFLPGGETIGGPDFNLNQNFVVPEGGSLVLEKFAFLYKIGSLIECAPTYRVNGWITGNSQTIRIVEEDAVGAGDIKETIGRRPAGSGVWGKPSGVYEIFSRNFEGSYDTFNGFSYAPGLTAEQNDVPLECAHLPMSDIQKEELDWVKGLFSNLNQIYNFT